MSSQWSPGAQQSPPLFSLVLVSRACATLLRVTCRWNLGPYALTSISVTGDLSHLKLTLQWLGISLSSNSSVTADPPDLKLFSDWVSPSPQTLSFIRRKKYFCVGVCVGGVLSWVFVWLLEKEVIVWRVDTGKRSGMTWWRGRTWSK